MLILIGETKGHLGASLYAREIMGREGGALGPPPPVDLAVEKRNADFVRSLIEQGLVNAAHDVSEGGIACAAAEMALASNQLFHVGVGQHTAANLDMRHWLFSEDQGRMIVSTNQLEKWQKLALQAGIRITEIGGVKSFPNKELILNEPGVCLGGENLPLAKLRDAHEGWLPTYMSKVD